MRGIKIKIDEKIKTGRTIEKYVKPQIIYIPLESKTGVTYKHLVKEGDYVCKGDIVAINEEINFPLHSSVSGYVIKGIMKLMNNGRKIKCIVIENDFKERYRNKIGAKRNISNYTKEEFLNMLQTSGITGLGGSDFPTFIKYNQRNIKCLLINGVECEPYASCDQSVMDEYTEEILECIDAILEIMNIKEAFIALKENNIDIIDKFNKYIGSYPNIKICGVSEIYPSGWEREVVRQVLGREYKYYPTEIGVIVNNVSTIYAIYEMLKYNRPLTERIITFTGNALHKPCNVKVKIGASVYEIIHYIDGYKKIEDVFFIAGGPMTGNSLPNDDVVITKDLNCVIILRKEKEEEESICINCGKCVNICPVNLMPVSIMKNLKNQKVLKRLDPRRCLECGLCSYICPSKLEVKECVKIAKGSVDNERI